MNTAQHNTELLNGKQAAEILGTTEGTLRVWRCTKRYPIPYVRIGRAIRYRRSDLEAFISDRTERPQQATA